MSRGVPKGKVSEAAETARVGSNPGLLSVRGLHCTDQNTIMLTDATCNDINIWPLPAPRLWSHHRDNWGTGSTRRVIRSSCGYHYQYTPYIPHWKHSQTHSQTRLMVNKVWLKLPSIRSWHFFVWSFYNLLRWEMSCRAAVSDLYDLEDNVCLLTVNFLPHLKFVRQLNKNQQWQFGVVSCWTLFLSHRFFVNDKNHVLRSRVKEVSTLKCKKQVQRFLIYKYISLILFQKRKLLLRSSIYCQFHATSILQLLSLLLQLQRELLRTAPHIVHRCLHFTGQSAPCWHQQGSH